MIAQQIRSFVLIGLALASASTARANDYWSICSSDAKGKLRDTFRGLPAVYVAGGTDPKAPCSGNVLPDGIYYFQVTTPSGSQLLSTDDLESRRILVFASRFAGVPAGGHATRPGPCESVIVQLSPYLPTPDPGCEYKIWLTRVEDYQAGRGTFGFLPEFSETDNFIVRFGLLPEQTTIRGIVFYDLNRNGVYDSALPEEVPLPGWKIQLSPGDSDTTFTDRDGHFEFLRPRDSASYTVTSVAPAPGFIPAVGGRWLATTTNPVNVVASVETRTVDFGNLAFENTPEFARTKNYWRNQAGPLLLSVDPHWRFLLNGYCLRTNQTNPPKTVAGTLFKVPMGLSFALSYHYLIDYFSDINNNGVLAFILSKQFAAALLNHDIGPLMGLPTYVDQEGDGVLVSLESMIEQTGGMLCDPRSANTGPSGDPAWRNQILMHTDEWQRMNDDGTNLFTRSRVPLEIVYH